MNAAWAAVMERTPTPLSVFLSSLPGSWEMQIFYGLMLSGIAGMFAHYLLKWARDEIKENLVCYWITNGKKTLLSLLTYTSLAMTASFNDAFVGELGGFVGWKMVLSWGWSMGLAIDVLVNRTDRAKWGLVERIRKKGAARDP